jgi:tetratricopeptide (TPR) repeat protein
MVGWLAFGFLTTAHAEEPAAGGAVDITPALEQPKKAKWDPKGKAIDPYGRGDSKRGQDQWDEAIKLEVDALAAQPGCGKCLNTLAKSLTGAKRFDDAAKVGQLMVQLYPDKPEGWARVSDAWNEAQKYQEAVDATSKLLELDKANADMWWRRNKLLIQLAKFDDAQNLLGGAEAAGLSKEDTTCLKVQILAATGKPVDGREIWPTCDSGQNVDLKHYTEGWLALAEGDKETASKRLVMAGTDDFARLVIAFIRVDQGKYDMAENLSEKLLSDDTWAIDGQLAAAEALHGLGRDADALKILDQKLMGPDWKTATYTLEQVLLKPYGEAWPKTVAQRAATLKVAIVAGSGDAVAAGALADEVKGVFGDTPELAKALDAPIGKSGVTRTNLQTALTASTPALKKCFDKEKKKAPTLAGQYVVGFTIGADGAVTGAATKSSTITSADLEKCTLGEIGKWKLPVTAGAEAAPAVFAVTYPLP